MALQLRRTAGSWVSADPALLARRAAVALLLGLYCYHGWRIAAAVVDAPYHDDWALVDLRGRSLRRWLFGLHVDHPILLTKLFVRAQSAIGPWNVAVHVLLNWLFYGLLVASALKLVAVTCPGRSALASWSAGLLSLLCVPMLSTLNLVNHHWAIQSSYHFFCGLTLATCVLLVRQSTKAALGASAAIALVPQTIAAGMLVASLCLPVFAARRLMPLRNLEWPSARRLVLRETALLGVPLMSLGLSIWRYLLGGSRGAFASEVALGQKLSNFGVLVGRSVLPGTDLPWLGWVLVSSAVVLAVRGLCRRDTRSRATTASLAFACLTGFLALVAVGRGPSALEVEQYAEIQILLPLLLGVLLCTAVKTARTQVLLLAGALAFVGWAYRGQWQWSEYQRRADEIHQQTVECSARSWRGWPQRFCLFAFPEYHDFSTDLKRAARAQISLYLRTAPAATTVAEPTADGLLQSCAAGPGTLELNGWTATDGGLRFSSNGRWITPRSVERYERPRSRHRQAGGGQRFGFRAVIDRDDAPTARLDGIQVLPSEARIPERLVAARKEAELSDCRRLPSTGDRMSISLTSPTEDALSLRVSPALAPEELELLAVHGWDGERWRQLGWSPRADPELPGTLLALRLPRAFQETPSKVTVLVPQRGFALAE